MSVWGDDLEVEIASEPRPRRRISKPVYQTELGAIFCGSSERVLRTPCLKDYLGDVQLVFTSPPFPLNTKKRYGNLQGDAYIKWFAEFAPLLKDYLTTDGSIVIEIGNAWERGRPVMSTVALRALLLFLESGGLNLCQEFIWYNPARLPSPIQWVNKERIRVKDAFTRIWWMSPSDRPKADNKKVLREYSDSMKKLLATGKYNSGPRPSGHNIGKDSFNRNNNGAIPPNVIEGTNTRSYDQYQMFCRERKIRIHPARMPREIVEFFVRFLTDKNDLVLDPFAGSNTTGAVAEELERRWLSVEAQWSYAASSIGRFQPDNIASTCADISVKQGSQAASESSVAAAPNEDM